MTLEQANKLRIHDKIDHCDVAYRFLYATIIDKQGTNLKIHYDGWSRKWDIWSDFNLEIHRFAIAGSISNRPSHRFTHLKRGDYIDVNPIRKHCIGWKCAEIRRLDHFKSGQVQVAYEDNGHNYLYWTHLDNINEIAEFTSKSGKIKKQIKNLNNCKKQKLSEKDIKNENILRKMLNESSVLLKDKNGNNKFEIVVHGKSYSFIECKINAKGNEKTKHFSSNKKAFDIALNLLIERIRNDWSIIDDENEEGIFNNCVFDMSGNLSKTQKYIKNLIRENNGIISVLLNKDTNFMIVKANNANLELKKCKQAKQLNIPIISENYIYDCIDKNKKLDYKNYMVNIDRNNNSNTEEMSVKLWLENKVKLGQYYTKFVNDGFDSMITIIETLNENDLNDMGIDKKGHRKKIMLFINDMRDGNNKNKNERNDSNDCIVCWERNANMFNYPCGHVTYCDICCDKVLEQNGICPNCREKLIECKRIYNAGFVNDND